MRAAPIVSVAAAILTIREDVERKLNESRQRLLVELALRQQLATHSRKRFKPRITPLDRAFWVALSRFWPRWRNSLVIVKPDTVIRWHRSGSLRNHKDGIAAMDFFVVPTITFRLRYIWFLIDRYVWKEAAQGSFCKPIDATGSTPRTDTS